MGAACGSVTPEHPLPYSKSPAIQPLFPLGILLLCSHRMANTLLQLLVLFSRHRMGHIHTPLLDTCLKEGYTGRCLLDLALFPCSQTTPKKLMLLHA